MRLPILLFSLVLLSGALGLRTIADCDADPEIVRDSELMNCYHAAAITHAYLGDSATAVNICRDIWYKFGRNNLDPNSDMVVKAEMVSNACYYDIALIIRTEPYICENIGPKRVIGEDAVETKLFGEAVSRERCKKEVERLAAIAPEHYHDPGADNLCSIIFIFPLLVFAALRNP